jgi:putative intracellular protease/amidase
MKKKILIVVSSADRIGPYGRVTGNLLTELGNAYETFKNQGYDIDIYSVKGGAAPLDFDDEFDPLNVAFLEGEGFLKSKNTKSIAELGSLEGYDALYIPGGLGPVVDMPDNETIHKIVLDFWENGKVVSAVCHGPVSLINVKLKDGSYLVNGKHVGGFSKAEEEKYAQKDVPFELEDALVDRGGIYGKSDPWQPYSVADGRLVTGQNPASAKGVAEKVIGILESSAS